MNTTPQRLLHVENLVLHFKTTQGAVQAVDGVDFDLDVHRAVVILGESGCGKSSLAKAILRLLPRNVERYSGEVYLQGQDVMALDEEEFRHNVRWVGMSLVPQAAMNALNPVQRIGDQIAEPMIERLGLSSADAAKRSRELLELVGIPKARARSYPHELSGGMRQRAMIAMALACDPAVVIGDEPTTALDVMVQAQILELLEDLRERLGLSLILITHDLSVLAETCDRVMIMYAGRVAEEGPVGRVFATPRHPYTQMLLRAFPDVHAGRRDLGTIPGSPPDLRTPPPGCRFHPRCPVAIDVCGEEIPPEVRFDDRVRVACHLYPPGSDGTPRALPVVEPAP